MNLYLLAWQFPHDQHAAAVAELRRVAQEVYPHLDPDTLWHHSGGQGALAASLHTAASAASPRTYVYHGDDHVTFFDGLPVDRTGRFNAHRAEDLAVHWQQLPQCLEGSFAAVRVAKDPAQIELLTDPLGMEHVYYLRRGDVWLLSNSVRLLERVGKATALDPLGVSLYFAVGWVGADRTLRHDVRVLPGGQKVVWRRDTPGPSHAGYFQRAGLARWRSGALTRDSVEALADSLTQMLRCLSRSLGKLNCPLSAGHDTRLLAALLIHAGIPARYFTFGYYDATDIRVASHIARLFGLEHSISDDAVEDRLTANVSEELRARWDEVSRRLVAENDGMVSLILADQLVGENTGRAARLGSYLHGGGGEIARSFYGMPATFIHAGTPGAVLRNLLTHLVSDHGGLITPEATGLARSYLRGFLEECLEEGFTPPDLPDLFYTYERVRRWVGNIFRWGAMREDHFYPFCTRPFIETAFSLSALYRWSEPIHYELIRHLVPRLLPVPSDKPWRSQRPVLNRLKFLGSFSYGVVRRQLPGLQPLVSGVRAGIRRLLARRSADQPVPGGLANAENGFDSDTMAALVEVKREQIREVCFSQPRSLVWSFVHRPAFERLLSPSAGAQERRRHYEVLYAIATVFYYDGPRNT
jgi:asparagine synthase (glutamine-hydrolysing)